MQKNISKGKPKNYSVVKLIRNKFYTTFDLVLDICEIYRIEFGLNLENVI